jgi:hypothetical protein
MELMECCLSNDHDIEEVVNDLVLPYMRHEVDGKGGAAAILPILFMVSLDPRFVGLRLVLLQFLT